MSAPSPARIAPRLRSIAKAGISTKFSKQVQWLVAPIHCGCAVHALTMAAVEMAVIVRVPRTSHRIVAQYSDGSIITQVEPLATSQRSITSSGKSV